MYKMHKKQVAHMRKFRYNEDYDNPSGGGMRMLDQSYYEKADEIIVLDAGQVKERGTHESLIAQKGLYYETYLAQYGDILKAESERKEA